MDSERTNIELDIDALAPPKMQIKFQGQTIDVNPPTVLQYAQIINFSEKITDSKGQDFNASAVIYQDIAAFIKQVIPQLTDTDLNFAQIMSIYKMLAEASAPTDRAMEKLKEQGIDLKGDDTHPKASASSEQ